MNTLEDRVARLEKIVNKVENTMDLSEKTIKDLKEWVEYDEELGENFNPCDASEGNFDDVWAMAEDHGYHEGRAYVAFRIIRELGL